MNLLLQHLFDAMAVGELIWDRYLPRGFRGRMDDLSGGEGKRLYVWLCGLHDVGKASPGFQGCVPEMADRVQRAGLQIVGQHPQDRWRHERVSALLMLEIVDAAWPAGTTLNSDWVWPILAGHHGVFPSLIEVKLRARELKKRQAVLGGPDWQPVQAAIVNIVTVAAGWPDLESTYTPEMPRKSEQLALSGFVTMADWIASDENHFCGVDQLRDVSLRNARGRAEDAWQHMGLRGGWAELPPPDEGTFSCRFRNGIARPLQTAAAKAAHDMAGAGLMVIEAPMGEGKTEAALTVAEIFASRFGVGGVYVAMPTQATSDAMFVRVGDWLRTFDGHPPLALLHGKRSISEHSKSRVMDSATGEIADVDVDEYGLADRAPSYLGVAEDAGANLSDRPAEWFYGRYRGLLTANGVGTIDQALQAATRSKYVALRYAGLSGKVVIFDEVHAADCYMSVFLREVLFWLGNGRVPVVLLSATLAPDQREELVSAYVGGSSMSSEAGQLTLPESAGYPRILTVSVTDRPHYASFESAPWRPSRHTDVTVLAEEEGDVAGGVVGVLRDRLSDGGCALVIRNTVRRAQDTYSEVVSEFGDDVVLLHSRLTASARARRTERLLEALGPDSTDRPARLVVVATQVAEQSFDVDADVLITDLAPIDLVLQRAGRIHRHDRPVTDRPERLRVPQVILTGMRYTDSSPWFPPGSAKVYGEHLLLRAAALVQIAAETGGWSIPADVPRLVSEAYGEGSLGFDWDDTRREQWKAEIARRRSRAEQLRLLSEYTTPFATLEGLHSGIEASVSVRDGGIGEEVVLIVYADGVYRTVDGVNLGPNGDSSRDRPTEVLGSSLGLPNHVADPQAIESLVGLPGWKNDPWLGRSRALILDADGRGSIGDRRISYQQNLGLVVENRQW
jgi:CRISPR-associated endonuclease/helicase Cas3